VAKRRKKPKAKSRPKRRSRPAKPEAQTESRFQQLYRQACGLAEQGQYEQARTLYQKLDGTAFDLVSRALVHNDLATLLAAEEDIEAACQEFEAALALDARCEPARINLDLLRQESPPSRPETPPPQQAASTDFRPDGPGPVRIALLSFLFNWPSTGGGIVHTYELAQFLIRAGFQVQHFYACYPPWGIGSVEGRLPFPSRELSFDEAAWDPEQIKDRFRAAVDAFDPDHVIITDSWNIKPLLAEAVRGYPYVLRLQAMELLCPLNNVRFLPEEGGRFRQCPLHQLANPEECARCLQKRGHLSGRLHRAERALSGVGTPDYHARLLRALREAEAVLVVNPLHEAMLSPYTENVRVVTAGMDPARFPWPWPEEPARHPEGKTALFFAGLVEEGIKGFDVLHEACALLWQKRQDFELQATGDPPGRFDAFTRFVGWQSQGELPRRLRAADALVMPTLAQEALGRTAVEAMAVGRPVVASRLGGLPFTVIDGATGLLSEPGDARDLARKIETLLDDPALRGRLGQAGRRRFEEHYSWDVIIERHYRPLFTYDAAV
jgi:glycosyltransferase involved in cell wall biosynthesis